MSNGVVSQSAVTVSLEDLRKGNVDFSTLEEAFGPSSLGIIVVKGLPEKFVELRHKLLSYSSYLANLPAEELVALESPSSHYLVGWSCGKETLKSGVYDTLKGSYYANPAPSFSTPSVQSSVAAKYPSFPEYTAPNVWPPTTLLPTFEPTFRALCELIIDVAVLVARACDVYALAKVEGYAPGYLEHVVRTSVSTKARLLHYFPPPGASPSSKEAGEEADDDDWCATHLDHGCLTGLTSAMFVDEAASPPILPARSSDSPAISSPPPPLPELSSSPDPAAGLYIRSRTNAVTKVGIPRDCLGFQTGEALEVITKGKFKAVPHFVRGASSKGGKVARNTLAVFTQPNLWEKVDGEKDFAAFAREIVARNH